MRLLQTIRPVAVVALILTSCDSPTEARQSDVDVARAAWLQNAPTSYRFEIAITSMIPQTPFYRVRVTNGEVVEATDPDGNAVQFNKTLDDIWDEVLEARARGDLNAVSFDSNGVPVEVDKGYWPVDGGVHYAIRNFVRFDVTTQ